MAARSVPPRYFALAASGTLGRKRLRIVYFARGSVQSAERIVSPRRLVYYRDNWYLEAWCHLRKGLRVFALDSIEDASLLEDAARNVPEAQLERELSGSYGIFAGTPTQRAVLRFSKERARWVAREQWHPPSVRSTTGSSPVRGCARSLRIRIRESRRAPGGGSALAWAPRLRRRWRQPQRLQTLQQ